MIDISKLRAACAAVVMLVSPSVAWSQAEPFGQPIGAWTFNQTPENGAIKCRAILKKGSQTIVLGGHNGRYYVSVNAGRVGKGKYPGSSLALADSSSDISVTSDGKRMWFQLEDFDMDKVAEQAAFVLNVALPNGDFGGGEVSLDRNAPKALARLFECIEANG